MNKSGVKNLAKKVPVFMLITGAVICTLLVLKVLSINTGVFNYYRHVLSVQLYQAIMFISIECGAAAVWFEFLRIKKDDESE